MSFDLKVAGLVTASPLPQDPAGLSKSMGLDVRKKYVDCDGAVFGVSGTPVLIGLGGSTVLKFLALRSVNGDTLLVEITTPAGSLQRVSVSDLLVLHNPATGTGVTVLRVTGPGRLEFVVAGDPA